MPLTGTLVDHGRAPRRSPGRRRWRACSRRTHVPSRRATSRPWRLECFAAEDVERTTWRVANSVVVVDAEFARRVWGDADPLGRELLFDGPPNQAPPRAKVVGVVESIHMDQLDAELRPTIYVPFSQAIEGHYLDWGMDVVVRGATTGLEPEIRRIVRSVFPDAVVFQVATMDDVVRAVDGEPPIPAAGAGVLRRARPGADDDRCRRDAAALRARAAPRARRAHGVRRPPESALVACAAGWHVLTAAGALVGVAGAVAGAGLFSSLTYGVSVRDPLSLAAGPVLVLVAAFVAAAIPATRAVRVSPIAVLRES